MKKRGWPLIPAFACAAVAIPTAQASTRFSALPAGLAAAAGYIVEPGCTHRILPAAGSVADAPLSKAASILGGAPSQMELILRQQGATTVGPAPRSLGVQAESEAVRGCANPSAVAAMRFAFQPAPQANPAPFPLQQHEDPNDFLSSRRLAVGRTAFDGQWARVSHAALSARTFNKLGLAGKAMPLNQRLAQINAWTNRRIRYTEDVQLYAAADFWANSSQTLNRNAGDCEDIAILKLQLLAAAGVPRSAMFLTIARDLARQADHAVLVVRDGDRHWLLDNATDQLIDASTARDYRPVFSFGASGQWIHGYSAKVVRTVETQPMVNAAQVGAPQITLSQAEVPIVELPDLSVGAPRRLAFNAP